MGVIASLAVLIVAALLLLVLFEPSLPYRTPERRMPVGSPQFVNFLSAIVNFLIVAFVLFLVIKAVNRFRAAEESAEKECPFCMTLVPKAATKCSACTSELVAE